MIGLDSDNPWYNSRMKLYRFAPIESEEQLRVAIAYLHEACNRLVFKSFGKYLPARGNVGIFAHYDDEFENLIKLRKQLTAESPNYKDKYFPLHEPIFISEKDGIPGATYNFLYIRRVDPYRSQVGDIDFVMPAEEHEALKGKLNTETFVNGARFFGRPAENMIELWDPEVDALPYVVTTYMRDKVR